MLLYTGQTYLSIKDILEHGQTYYCIHCSVMQDDTELSLKYGYQWMMDTMESVGINKPELAKYPIWLTPELENAKDYSDNVLVFEIPDTEVLLSDEGLFGLAAPICNADCFDINECLNIEDDSFIQATVWHLKPEWFKGTL